MDHRARERARDPVDELNLRHDHPPELVDRPGLGPQDDVVRPGHVAGLHHTGALAPRIHHRRILADLGLYEDVRTDGHGGLPRTVWGNRTDLTLASSASGPA